MRVTLSKDELEVPTAEKFNETRKALATSTPFSRASELLTKIDDPEFNLYAMAYERGMNVSTLLEVLDPSGQHENTNLDAFERIMRASGIRMNSDPRRMIFASRIVDFEARRATKVLLPELFARCYRAGVHSSPSERASATYLSGEFLAGSIMKPWATRQEVIKPVIQNAIPLSALVAQTTGINGEDYRGFYVDDDVDARRMKRVVEAAELPRTKITGRENAVKLYKYGRAIEISYERLRRMQIDWVNIHLQMIAAQAEADKVAEVIDVLIDGDGNNNAIETVDLSDLDADADGLLTLKAWLGFEMEFENPYVLNVVIGQKGPILEVRLLNTGSANVPLQNGGIIGLNNFRLINRTADNVSIGWTSDAPASKLLGLDSSKAVERVYEIGASISEIERFITRQVEVITLSEQEGYAILDKKARKVLDLNG